jgi:UPF0716 protein FxsA
MNSVFRTFLRALHPEGLHIFISRLMLAGLLFLGDGLVLLYLSSRFGGLLSTALAAASSLLGALVVGSSFSRHSRLAMTSVAEGRYPRREFVHLSGLFFSLILVCVPGLFTALAGAILYLPPVRQLAGTVIHSRYGASFEELYAFSRAAED